MASYLTAAAASDYLGLVHAQRSFGIIGQTIFLERLSVLARIGDPSDPAAIYASAVLLASDLLELDDDWGRSRNEPAEAEKIGKSGHLYKNFNNKIYFMTAAGGLKNWFFRPGDPDFFPSVPHGHFENRDNPKLDAYLGWMYSGSTQVGRVARSGIIALWNDDDFRSIAAASIEYYLGNHRHYHGWRVDNPRRLPRRRK